MPIEFQMPKLGLTMEEGTIIEWLVAQDAEVEKGQPVLSIETDKVETEIESSAGGQLHQIAKVGETISCGSTLGWFSEMGEDIQEYDAGDDLRSVSASQITDLPRESDQAAQPQMASAQLAERIPVSPNARRLAKNLGVDLETVQGSGKGGRIVSGDIEAASQGTSEPDIPSQTLIPLRGMRRTIATRMSSSLREMAQLTLTMDVVMDKVVEDREERSKTGNPPGYTDYVVHAAAVALVRHPVVNSEITEEGIVLHPNVDIGMAVALEDGLIVPVIRSADSLGLTALCEESTRLAMGARSSTLKLGELKGGTFAVTALGMFGVDAFTPVINPPNTAILGIGRIRDGVRWVSAEIPVQEKILTLSFTWDHQAFDGAPAALFVGEIRDILQSGEFPD